MQVEEEHLGCQVGISCNPWKCRKTRTVLEGEIEISVKRFDSLGQFVSILTGQTLLLQMLSDVANA
jgi:hypothetical protein